MKKLLAILLSAFMLIGLFGCSGGGNQKEDNGTIGTPWWTTTGELQKEDGKVVFDNIDINMTTVVTGDDIGPFNQLIAEFNALYRGQINVSVTPLGQGAFESVVSNQITNNSNPPDLIMSHQKGHRSFAQNKLIQPFDEAMEISGIEISLEDVQENLAAYSSLGYEGYTFNIPVDFQSCVVFYNKKLLNEFGGELPENREELIALCTEVANAKGIVPIAWPTKLDFFYNYIFPTAILQNGGHLFDQDTYYADWYSDADNLTAVKKAIKSIRDLMTSSPQIAAEGLDESDATSRFVNNQALFYVGMPWRIDLIIESYAKQNGNLDEETVKADYIGAYSLSNWFALDGETESGKILFGDSHAFAISKTVTDINKKAAICEFVQWFTQTNSVGATWAAAGHMTLSTKIAESEEYKTNEIVQDFLNEFYPYPDSIECPGITPYYTDTLQQLTQLLSDALIQTNDAKDEDIIKSAQDSLNSIIDFINM